MLSVAIWAGIFAYIYTNYPRLATVMEIVILVLAVTVFVWFYNTGIPSEMWCNYKTREVERSFDEPNPCATKPRYSIELTDKQYKEYGLKKPEN